MDRDPKTQPYEIQHHAASEPVVEVVNRVDVASVAARLRARSRRHVLTGYRGGKRRMQDTLRRSMRIGPSRAAYLVDRLEAEGAIVYARPPRGGRKRWYLPTAPPKR